jgi:lipopolysaccharide export system permease protein
MVAVSSVLLLIFLSGRFVGYLSEAAAGRISADSLLWLISFRFPGFLELILPLGLFIGILLAYGRMYLESEMTVLHACGASPHKLLVLTILSSIFVSFIVAAMSLYLTPKWMRHEERMLANQSKLTEFDLLSPGRFQGLKSGQRVTYTEAISDDKKVLKHVFISEKSPDGKKLIVLSAESGTLNIDDKTGSRFLLLHHGKRFDGIPGEANYKVVSFDTYGVKLHEQKADDRGRKIEYLKTQELLASSSPEARAMLQWRISVPLLVPIVTLLAVPLSRVNPRQGRFFHLLPAMLIYITYLGLLIVSRKALSKDQIPEWLGMWWVHILFLAIGLFLQFKQDIKLRLQARKGEKLSA